jgi:hypothetical protein
MANASKSSAVSYHGAAEMTEQLGLEVQQLMEKAEQWMRRPLEEGLTHHRRDRETTGA